MPLLYIRAETAEDDFGEWRRGIEAEAGDAIIFALILLLKRSLFRLLLSGAMRRHQLSHIKEGRGSSIQAADARRSRLTLFHTMERAIYLPENSYYTLFLLMLRMIVGAPRHR